MANEDKIIEMLTNIQSDIATMKADIDILKSQRDYNKLDDKEKLKLKSTVKDVLTITKNVKKFSEKLNKRFLLFRLMF